jgi:pSer/pThr/pTyr-binding forkhead associated (FHA) protein
VRANGEPVSVQSFPKGRIIVGRSPDNEIYIKSKFVSRHHAQIVSDDDGCMIEDLNSTNGVFVNEKQTKKHQLADGDIVSLGVHQLIYRNLRATGDGDDELEEGGGASEVGT